MTHALHIDPHALAARLRLWALGLVVELVAWLGEAPLTRALAAWVRRLLHKAERGAMGLIVLAAVRQAPPAPPPLRRTQRPLTSPHGFRCRATRDPRIAQMARGLFPRQRNLLVRARRLAATLADIDTAALRVLRRLLRSHAWTQLVAISPPAAPCEASIQVEATCIDSS